jgi:hypothetical protein
VFGGLSVDPGDPALVLCRGNGKPMT